MAKPCLASFLPKGISGSDPGPWVRRAFPTPPLLVSPALDPASGSPRGVVEYLAEVARAVNQLREQQA
eukprot:9969639-Alexandrium_andersonii.AAC.1